MIIVYLDKYKPDEEALLRSRGFLTSRSAYADLVDGRGLSLSSTADHAIIFRGPRLSPDRYDRLYNATTSEGYEVLTDLKSFRTAEDFALHYPLLRSQSPKSLVLQAPVDVAAVLDHLRASDLRLPVFVRTEKESAAKYVGIEGCVIRDQTRPAVEQVLKNIAEHVGDFQQLILKEVRDLKRSPDGHPLEYRSVGLRGRFLDFDFDPSSIPKPDPSQLGLQSFAERAFQALGAGGVNGLLFVDVALMVDGGASIVECKDFMNGTLGNPVRVFDAIRRALAE